MQVEGDSEVKSKLNAVGDEVEDVGKKTEQSANSAVRMQTDYLNAAGGFSTAAISIASLGFQFDALEKVSLRVDRANAAVSSSQATLVSAQNSLNKLVEKGVTSGPQYEVALLRVKSAQEQLAINTQNASIAQDDVSQAYLDFSLSVVPTALSAVSGIQSAMTALRGVQFLGIGATAAQSATTSAAAATNVAYAGATATATTATGGMTLATRMLTLAMGPIGIAILGVSTFMALFATNAFGIRDAINAAGKAIGDAIPILRPLLDMLGGIANALFPQAAKEAGDFGATATTSLTEVSQQYPELATASTMSADTVVADYERIAGQSQQTQQMTAASLSLMTQNVGTSVTAQSAAFADLGKAAVDAGNAVAQSFASAASSAEKAANRIASAARAAASAMRSIGTSAGSSNRTVVLNAKKAATGFSGIVNQPTLFLTGEAGPERVNIAPVGASSSGGGNRPVMITVVTTLDGREVARSVSRHQAENI